VSVRWRPRCCAFLVVVVMLSTTACAGHSTKPKSPAPASPAGLFPAEQAWIQDLDDPATSAAVANQTRVFLPVVGHVRAFARETGEPAWTIDLDTRWPLALLGNSLYALTEDSIVEIDPASGTTRRRALLPASPTAGMAWTDDMMVVAVSPSSLIAWRTTDLQQRWARDLPAAIPIAPLIVGDTVVAALDNGRVTALRSSDGVERWSTTTAGAPRALVATRSLAVVASSDRYIYALNAETGTFAWPTPRKSSLDVVGLLIDDARVYVVSLDNTVRAYDHRGGLKWRKAIDTRPTAAPTLSASGILIAGVDYTLTLVALKDQPAVLGTYTLPDLSKVTTPPVVLDGAGTDQVDVIVATQNGLIGLKPKPLPKDDKEPNEKVPAEGTKPEATVPAPAK
jgi:outer membrane protein assembly factor BamB